MINKINQCFWLSLIAVGILFGIKPVLAQELVTGLSHEEISITSDFNGSELVVFGAINDLDQLPPSGDGHVSMGHTDIVVTIEGPKEPRIIRKKRRTLGIWVNRDSVHFETIPASYLMMTSSPEEPEGFSQTLANHNLGLNNISFGASGEPHLAQEHQEFREAVVRLKTQNRLYQEAKSIRFLGDNLFMAKFDIPALIPVGTHLVKSHLLFNNKVISKTTQEITITKRGFEQVVYTFSRDYGYLYGLVCVLLAIVTGWLSSVIFKRD